MTSSVRRKRSSPNAFPSSVSSNPREGGWEGVAALSGVELLAFQVQCQRLSLVRCGTMVGMPEVPDGDSSGLGVDLEAAKQTAEDVVAAMFAIPEGEQRFPRGWWPNGCCENAATAIAGVLADRGLGDWLLVSGKRPGEMNGHMWLELRDDSGTTLYSIDVTLHQMQEFEESFVGEGVSPAATVFTEHREAYSLLDWPWLGDENAPFRANLRQVRGLLER